MLDELADSSGDTFSDLGSMIRKRGTGEAHRRPVALRPVSAEEASRIRQREEAAKLYAQLQAVNKFREKVRKVESEVASLTPFSHLVSEFFDAKYFALDYELFRCARFSGDLGREFRLLKFSREVANIGLRVSAFSDAFRELVHELNEEFIRPRVSARKKVDRLLNSAHLAEKKYRNLQDLFLTIHTRGRLMSQILESLANDRGVPSERRETYRALRVKQIDVDRTLVKAGHYFRTFYLIRKELEGPFGASSLTRLLSQYAHVPPDMRARSKTWAPSIKALIGPNINQRKYAPSYIMRRFYMRRLSKSYSARDPRLNIFWRQLDALAPFELNWVASNYMSNEIMYLFMTLRYPSPGLWSNLDFKARRKHAYDLKSLQKAFDYTRGDIAAELHWLRRLNWLRLKSETKIHNLGGTAFTVRRGLFTPVAPLSQDLSRFDDYIFKTSEYITQTMVLQVITENHMKKWWTPMKVASDRAELHEEEELDDDGKEDDVERQTQSELLPLGAESEPQNNDTSSMKARTRFSVRRAMSSTSSSPLTLRVRDRMKPLFAFKKSSTLSARARGSKTLNDEVITMQAKLNRGTPGNRSKRSAKKWKSAPVSATSELDLRELEELAEKASRSQGQPLRKPKSPKRKPYKVQSNPWKSAGAGNRRRLQSEGSLKDSPSGAQPVPQPNDTAITIGHSRPKRKRFYGPSSSAFPRRCSTVPGIRGGSSADGHSENDFSFVADFSAARTDHNALNSENLESTGSSPDTETAINGFTAQVTGSDDEKTSTPQFWSHNLHKGPGGKGILVHYCKTLENTERIASHFLQSDVVGFDIEWKPQTSSSTASIKDNISLIQLANEERIALFHIALFRPGETLDELVAPSLKAVLESSNITKVGVSIKADCTRVRRYLGINVQGQLELSHLYKLVKYSQSNPKLINKRAVNLSLQVEEHLGLPLYKEDEVRRSDWSRPLDYRQVQCKFIYEY